MMNELFQACAVLAALPASQADPVATDIQDSRVILARRVTDL